MIHRLYLDNTGIDDEQLALILHGVSKQQKFKSLVVQNNTFGDKATEEI